jgi:four helix bundle protein
MMLPRRRSALFGMADFKKLRVWSVPTNIVEGRGKKSDRDFAQFLGYALGSACELEYHIMVARDVGEMSRDDYSALHRQVIDIKRMLHGLIDKLSEQ